MQYYKKKWITSKTCFHFFGYLMGLEPTTPGTTIRCSNQAELQVPYLETAKLQIFLLNLQRKKGYTCKIYNKLCDND